MLLDDGDALRLDAPLGTVFSNSGCHSEDLYLDGWKRLDAYKELLEGLSGDLTDCLDTDCDCCVHERLTFDDLHHLYRGERLA